MSFKTVSFEARVGQDMDNTEMRIKKLVLAIRDLKQVMNGLKTKVTNETGFGAPRTAEITTRISEMKTLLLTEVNTFDK